MKANIFLKIFIAFTLISLYSCKTYDFRKNYRDANSMIHETENLLTKPFLKAHLKNGDVCILKDTWVIDSNNSVVKGTGTQFDFTRLQINEGELIIPFDSIVIFETNEKLHTEAGRLIALGLLTAVNLGITTFCITNPKACFGSCPTFYINPDDNFHYSDAEGFSNAISPSMEYSDIDALGIHSVTDKVFSITMKNEALETHVVRDVRLMAYPLQDGERLYHTPKDDFFVCTDHYPLTQALADEGDITMVLSEPDRQERFSPADEKNMVSMEEIILHFSDVNSSDQTGLIVHFRQSLMTTYIIYSVMDYLGDKASDRFALMEKDPAIRDRIYELMKALGYIEVWLWHDGGWKYQGHFSETGPIAVNRQFIPLDSTTREMSDIKLKLVLNRGLWRIDYVGLASIKEQAEPYVLQPVAIFDRGQESLHALKCLLDIESQLISMPGSNYRMIFSFPEDHEKYDLFLYAKGYYLEWMRPEWVRSSNMMKFFQVLYNPSTYLRLEARRYKEYEKTMEEQFWNSRIDSKIFTYYEN